MQPFTTDRRYTVEYTVRAVKSCTLISARTGIVTYRKDSVMRCLTESVRYTARGASIYPTTTLRVGRGTRLLCPSTAKNSTRHTRHRTCPTTLALVGIGRTKNTIPMHPRSMSQLTTTSHTCPRSIWRTQMRTCLRTLVPCSPSVRIKNTLRVFISPRIMRIGCDSNGAMITKLRRKSYMTRTPILTITNRLNAFYFRKETTSSPSTLSQSSMPQTSSERRTPSCRKTTTDEPSRVGTQLSLLCARRCTATSGIA